MVSATLHERLLDVATTHAARPAVHAAQRTVTYGEVADRSRATAAAVAARTAHGDRVAMIAWNDPIWIEAYFGVPMAGRSLAMVSPRLSVGELREALDVAGPRLVVVDPTVVADDLDALAAAGRDVVALDEWRDHVAAEGAGGARTGEHVAPDEPAWLVFTSGTTGRPKAASLTHRNLLAAIDTTEGARPTPPDDVYLYPFPLWHVAGYNVVNRLVGGHQVVLQPRFDPAAILADVARFGVTSMSVAATMLAAILDVAERDPAALARLGSLRELYYGAAPMPAALLRRTLDRLDVDVWQGYGMTELSGNAVFLSAEDHRRARAGDESLRGATGRPGPGVELRVVDDDGNEVAPGVAGEVLVRGGQVTVGYWGDEAATAAAFTADGWLRTGDLGAVDSSGVLRLVDRKKDVIITGGENVSAREVEEVLREHPSVADVAVVGLPDSHWVEVVCAVVVPHGAAPSLDELRSFARADLAGFKLPRALAVRDRLPVNASGKVVKAELRAWLAAEPERISAASSR